MKKIALVFCLILFTGILTPNIVLSQNEANNNVTLTIDGSALLGIETGDVALSLGGATVAGAAVQDVAADTTGRLRISSLVSGTTTRTITASLGSDMTTSNTELLVKLLDPNANFNFPANKGTLETTDQLLSTGSVTLATGIGTCWSGTGSDDGYPIAYTFRRKSGETAFTTPGLIVVTYTLSNAN